MMNSFFKYLTRFFIAVCIMCYLSCAKNESNSPLSNTPAPVENYLYTIDYQDTTPLSNGNYSYYKKLVCYDETYNILWEKKLQGTHYGLLIKKGVIYLSLDYTLTAIDLKSGIIKWKSDNNFGAYLQVAEKNDTLFYTHIGNNAYIEATNAINGQLYWQVPLLEKYNCYNAGLLDDTTYYYNSSANLSSCKMLNAFDTRSKKLKWSTPCFYYGGPVVLKDSSLFFTAQDLPPLSSYVANVLSFNCRTGKQNWKVSNMVSNTTPNFISNNDGLMVVSNTGTYYPEGARAINMFSGATTWTRFTDIEVLSLCANENKIFMAGTDKTGNRSYKITCADIATGNIIWTHFFNTSSRTGVLNFMQNLQVYGNVVYGSLPNKVTTALYPDSYTIMSFNINNGNLIDSAKIQTYPASFVGMRPNLYLVDKNGNVVGNNTSK